MKNLIISVLAMQIITGFSFWEFSGNDRLFVGFGMIAVLWIILESFDEWLISLRRKRRMQRDRARRFALDVIDLTNDKEAI